MPQKGCHRLFPDMQQLPIFRYIKDNAYKKDLKLLIKDY